MVVPIVAQKGHPETGKFQAAANGHPEAWEAGKRGLRYQAEAGSIRPKTRQLVVIRFLSFLFVIGKSCENHGEIMRKVAVTIMAIFLLHAKLIKS